MPTPFTRWSDEITTAIDIDARRQLLTDIARWRAGHLTDLDGLREAAFAIARLLELIGEVELAIKEASSLVSLCQTPPQALPAVMNSAVNYLVSLGGDAPKGWATKKDPKAKHRNKSKSDKKDLPVEGLSSQIVRMLREGKTRNAHRLLESRRNSKKGLLKVMIELQEALLQESEQDQLAGVKRVQSDLFERFGSRHGRPNKKVGDVPSTGVTKAQNREKKRDSGVRQMSQLLTSGAGKDEMAALLAEMPKRFRAFQAAREMIEDVGHGEADLPIANFLIAMDEVSEPEARLAQGVTMAVTVSALSGPESACRALLKEGSTARRYAKPAIESMIDAIKVVAEAGWQVRRLIYGICRDDIKRDPSTRELDDNVGGLWRLQLIRGEEKRELLCLQELTDAGRTLAGQLLGNPSEARVVVTADDADLSAWVEAQAGQAPIELNSALV